MFLFGIALNIQNKEHQLTQNNQKRLIHLPAVRTWPSSVSLSMVSTAVVGLSSWASVLLVRAAHVLAAAIVALWRAAALRSTSVRHSAWSSRRWLVLRHRFCSSSWSAVTGCSTPAESVGRSRSVASSLRLELFPKISVRSCEKL